MNDRRLFRDKYSRLEILIYVISWAMVFLLPVLVEAYGVLSGEHSTFHTRGMMRTEWLILQLFLLFLLNNFVLLPQLFFKHRKGWYLLALVACFVALWYVQVPPGPRAHAAGAPEPPRPLVDMFHVTNLIIEVCVVLANFAIKLYVQSLRRDLLMLNIRNEKISSELESLKYQISPHFLMNTLNNIQSLIESDPSRAYYTIQGLSRMMRYLLYENSASEVPLQKEVDFMSDFVDMMKMRYPESVLVTARFPVDCSDVSVPPLLFISFIENAFKHGVSYTGESMIFINLDIEEGRLHFRCANSKRAGGATHGDRRGLGIENVRRRLQLIYGEEGRLKISDTDRMYVVEMELPLQVPRLR